MVSLLLVSLLLAPGQSTPIQTSSGQGGPGLTAAPTNQEKAVLATDWEYVIVSGDSAEPPKAGWQKTSIPKIEFFKNDGQRASFWYRKTLKLPATKGKRPILTFLGGHYQPTVWLDGKQIAHWTNGWTPHDVDLTDYVKPGGGSYELVVQCHDRSVTNADGFVPPANSPESALQGKVLWPIGGYKDMTGLWLPVELSYRANSYISEPDLDIVTRLKGSTISLSGRVLNPEGTMTVHARAVDADGKAVDLGRALVGSEGKWSLESKLVQPRLWSPERPHLYRLELALDGAEGGLVEKFTSRFGFREVTCVGPNIFLNGVRRNLLATSTWPITGYLDRKTIRERIRAIKKTNAIAVRLHIGPWQPEFVEIADEEGLLMVDEAPVYTDGSGFYAYQDPRFWQNYRTVVEGIIRRDRRHPSLIMWSIGNEILFMGNLKYDANLPKKQGDLARFVKALDPTRLTTFEADLDPDGAYDVIGLHYPHELPNQYAYPAICDWLGTGKLTEAAGGMLGTSQNQFKWDRKKPLYIGEYLWVPQGDYSPGSVFFGAKAYENRDRWNSSARVASWRDQTIAYRRAGVTGLSPWTAFGFGFEPSSQEGMAGQADFYKPVTAYLRGKAIRGFAGKTISKTFDVFNDSPETKRLTLQASLDGLPDQRKMIELAPGTNDSVDFTWTLPARTITKAPKLTTRLSESAKEFDVRTYPVLIADSTRPTTPSGVVVIKPDLTKPFQFGSLPGGKNLVVQLEAGILSTARPVEAGKLPLVGGNFTASRAIQDFIREGGRVVVQEQETLAPLGIGATLVPHASTMAFADEPGFPDLKFWGSDMYVARHQVKRTGIGGLRSLATSGGPDSLAQGPIAFQSFGKGYVAYVQAETHAKANQDPLASQTLKATIAFLSKLPDLKVGPVLVFGDDKAVLDRLEAIRLDMRHMSQSAPPNELQNATGVVVIGSQGVALAGQSTLKAAQALGIPILWLGVDEKAYQAGAAALGSPGISFSTGSLVLNWHGRDDLLRGVTAEEFTLTTPPQNWDHQISPIVGTAAGAFVPSGSGATTRYVGKSFTGSDAIVTGDTINLDRRSTLKTKIKVGQAGWYCLRLDSTASDGVRVEVQVNRVKRDWLELRANRQGNETWVWLPAGASELAISFMNGSSYGGGLTFALHGVSLTGPTQYPAGVKVLAAPGTVVSWKAGSSTLLATTLTGAAMAQNPEKANRMLGAWCGNLGMSFGSQGQPITYALPTGGFVIESGNYNSANPGDITLRSAGAAHTDFYAVRSGQYVPHFDAESSVFAGEYARFAVRIDGKLVGEVQCNGTGVRSYALPAVQVSEGKHTFQIEFLNDASGGGEDRNLFVRRVAFGGE